MMQHIIKLFKKCDDSEKVLIDAPYNKGKNNFKRFNNLFEFVETL